MGSINLVEELKTDLIYPIYKTGNKTICNNYRRISLLYHIQDSVCPLLNKLKPYALKGMGQLILHFTGQVFCLNNSIKRHINTGSTLHFIDFIRAYNSVRYTEYLYCYKEPSKLKEE